MDEADRKRLGPRGRRAFPLIAAALAVIVVTGLLYLRASAPAPAKIIVAPASPAVLSSQFTVAYDFLNPSLGWSLVVETLGSHSKFWVYRTTDGAGHWSQQFTDQRDASGGTPRVQFFDATHGLISFGYPTELYRTSDGGSHWKPIALPATGAATYAFNDARHGWVLGNSGAQEPILHLSATGDGGDTWIEVSWPQGGTWNGGPGPDAVHFRGANEGWLGAAAAKPTVYATADGGVTWQSLLIQVPPQAFPTPSPSGKPYPGPAGVLYRTDVNLLPGSGVVAIVIDDFGNARAFTSFDRGRTWQLIALPPGQTTFGDYLYVDATHWWAMRFGFLFKTSDAGQTWNEVHVPPLLENWGYRPGQVIDATHVWARLISNLRPPTGTALAMSSDAGVTWKPANVPKPG